MNASSSALKGWRVVVTRAADRAATTADALSQLGATPLLLPTIAIAPPPSWDDLDQAIAQLERYDWLLLTSANAVRSMAARLSEANLSIDILGQLSVACVGTATAKALEELGRTTDLVPAKHDAATMAEELIAGGVASQRMLFPQAIGGRRVLYERLREAQAVVDVAAAYQTICPTDQDPDIRAKVETGAFDAVFFASPSAVRGFVSLFGDELTRSILAVPTVVSIGRVTERALEKLGLRADIVPEKSTAEEMMHALVCYASRGKP